MSMAVNFEPGSFKDPEGRILYLGDRVLRVLSPSGQVRMERLWRSGLVQELIDVGLMVPSSLEDASKLGLTADVATGLVIEHKRVPVVTYPFEWSFDMLREAARVTLELLERCLKHNIILKDATAYNVMLYEGRMCFIDTLSLDDYKDGDLWDGYAQFCREFLFPLMLTSYKGIEFHAVFRARLNGLTAFELAQIFSLRDRLRPGVLKHVILQHQFEKSFARQNVAVRSSFKDIKFSKESILSNLRSLRKLIDGLRYEAGDSTWIDYTSEHSYSASDEERKHGFVEAALSRLASSRLVDLGTNTGTYAFLAAPLTEQVIAMDIDPACINALARSCQQGNIRNIVPIVGDLLNPSPALGWGLCERKSLLERLKSESFLALALVHHICIGGNVPLDKFVALLADIAPSGVVEWVAREDSMVQRMLRNRIDVFDDYTWDNFQSALRKNFVLVDTLETHEGNRKLCHLAPLEAGNKNFKRPV